MTFKDKYWILSNKKRLVRLLTVAINRWNDCKYDFAHDYGLCYYFTTLYMGDFIGALEYDDLIRLIHLYKPVNAGMYWWPVDEQPVRLKFLNTLLCKLNKPLVKFT